VLPDCCAKKLLAFFGDPLCFLACADSPATVDASKTPSTYSIDDVNEKALRMLPIQLPAMYGLQRVLPAETQAARDSTVTHKTKHALLRCGSCRQMPQVIWDTHSQQVLCGDDYGVCDQVQLMILYL